MWRKVTRPGPPSQDCSSPPQIQLLLLMASTRMIPLSFSICEWLSVFHTFSCFFPNAPLLKTTTTFIGDIDLQLFCKTKLCWFLLGTARCIRNAYAYIHYFFQISFHIGQYRILSGVSVLYSESLLVPGLYIQCVCPNFPLPLFPSGNPKFVFYIYAKCSFKRSADRRYADG